MLRRVDITNGTEKPMPKGFRKLPGMPYMLVKDGAEIEARIDVIIPNNCGDRVRVKDIGTINLTGVVTIEVGLEDLLCATQAYLKAHPRPYFYQGHIIERNQERAQKAAPVYAEPILPKKQAVPSGVQTRVVPHKKKEDVYVSADAAEHAALLRNTLRNRGTAMPKKIVTCDKKPVIVPAKQERPPAKMSLEEMGVGFAAMGSVEAVAQRYNELHEHVETKKTPSE